MRCDFCDEKEVREREILRTSLVRAFPSYMPIVPGHLLVCPVRCVPTFNKLTDLEVSEILTTMERLKDALKEVYGADSFHIAWNEGKRAGQTVHHFHMHIVPRAPGDTGIVDYEPRVFLYRPSGRQTSPGQELRSVAAEIRLALEI